jgi:uncharacterized protein YtpQ (UPF0354 family)
MRRLLVALVFVVGWGGMADADALAPRLFAEEMARALRTALPAATVTITRDLELVITTPGRNANVDLSNPYRDYTRDPQRLGVIVQTFVKALSAPLPAAAGTSATLDRTRIVPVIKDKQWLTETQNGLRAQGTQNVPDFAVERFNTELVIAYAQDEPGRTRYLTTAELAGEERAALRSRAVDNLKRLLPKIELQQGPQLSVITAGGDYEASLLLVDELWSGGQIKVDGDIVVAIPARDMLFITGSRNRAGLKALRELAAKAVAEEPHPLTATLFVYRNGRFGKFGRD